MSTLRLWVSEMAEHASRVDSIDPELTSTLSPRGPRVFDVELQAMLEQWTAWFVAETVRRTHVIVSTILNVYLCLSTGGVQCSGFLMLTARHGLWQAESASRWSKMVSTDSPLLVSIMNPKCLLTEYLSTWIEGHTRSTGY